MEEERDEISREEFDEVLELTRENNRILKGIQRSSRWRKVLSVLYFILIIGSMLYLYYFLQPYIENIMDLYEMSVSGNDEEKALIQEFVENQLNTQENTSQ